MKKRVFFRLTSIFALSLAARVSAQALEISHILNARLFGGQYFFQNEESKLSGNIGVMYAPAIAFNQKWSLIPTVSSSWRGVKSVQDLVGGGTLFQQVMDHSGGVKAIYSATPLWRLKLGGAYRLQLLKETSDEKWGKGLYDFEKPSGNFEIERLWGNDNSARIGADYYIIDFRNFTSLESQQKELGRENASARTLNTRNQSPYVATSFAFPFLSGQSARLDASYYHVFRGYDDQNIVLASGDLSKDRRSDSSQLMAASFLFPFAFSENFKLIHEVKGGLSQLFSKQNNFDARLTRFNPNYYSYRDFNAGTNFNFLIGAKPWIASSGFNYVRRTYNDRPIQDVNGAYGVEKVHINEYYANFGLTYSVNKNLKVQGLLNFGWSRSNMKYEKSYRYNYEVFTYLLGVVYEY